jgi:Ca2+/Na+ antiporter
MMIKKVYQKKNYTIKIHHRSYPHHTTNQPPPMTTPQLTIPWCLSIYSGRVNIVSGSCKYSKPKLIPAGNKSLFGTGVEGTAAVARCSKILLATMLPYLIIQGPAFGYHCGKKDDPECHGAGEKYWALGGLVVCMLMFIGYLWDQVRQSQSQAMRDRIDEVRKSAIHNSVMSLTGVFAAAGVESFTSGSSDSTALLADARKHKRLRRVLKSFFRKYDRDSNGFIDASELRSLLLDLHENPSPAEFATLMAEMDTDNSGSIDFEEFFEAMVKAVIQHSRISQGHGGGGAILSGGGGSRAHAGSGGERVELESINSAPHADHLAAAGGEGGEDEDDEEEEEEVPEDLAHLSPEQQQRRIKIRSAWMMTVGTLLVLLFSDAAVDVLAEFGKRIHVPAFYVSFVLAPLASNASELLASANYAAKKTKKTISISFVSAAGKGMSFFFFVGRKFRSFFFFFFFFFFCAFLKKYF